MHPKHVLNCLSVHEHAVLHIAPSKGEDNYKKNLCFRDTLKNIWFCTCKGNAYKNKIIQKLKVSTVTYWELATFWHVHTLQMKGRWDSDINVWLPFMYFQKWNCYFQNIIIMFSLPVPTLIYLWDLYISRIGLPILLRGPILWMSECGNSDWGSAIPTKEIHKWDFPIAGIFLAVQFPLNMLYQS